MQGSNLTITVKAIGIPEAEAQLNKLGATMTKLTVNQNGTVSATGKLTSALNQQGKATDGAASATRGASKAQESYFGHIARTTVQSALINKLFLEFVDVSGQAIKQVDLMNNFPATMASMGQATEQSNAAFQALRDYVGQVGGNLGDAASAVTRFTGVTKDVKAAVAVYTGLNNALIAGDSTLEEQRLSAIQFAQAFERGKPDMREWLSLTQNMSFQLSLVAKEMGFISASALGESLRAGETSMADFTTKLTQLSTGTGPIAIQAMARMNGLQFSFNVLKNTMVQGLAAIINAFGRSNIVSFFTFLTQVVRVLTGWVITLINALGALANRLSAFFGGGQIFKAITGDTQKVADNIGTGAGNAGDLKDGLDDAGDSAKKLNKGLAAFDKMNVLADKESDSGSGKDKDAPGGGTNFDAGQLGALGDVFGDIAPDLQEASKWAKIFAGILAGLAANKLIEKIFGVNPLKLFGKALFQHAIIPLGKNFVSAAGTALKTAGTFGVALGRGLLGLGSGGSGILGEAAGLGARIGLALRGGFITVFSGIGGVLRTVLISPLASVGRIILTALISIVGAVAAALGVPFAVAAAIVVAAVLVIVGIIWLIWTNWETIWNFIKALFDTIWTAIVTAWNTLFEVFRGPVEFLWQFWSSVFILIVAIVATALELMFKLVVGTIKLIYDVLAAIAGWIWDNVIVPVAEFFVALWKGIVDGVTAAWNWIFEHVLRPVATWINTNVIQPTVGFFKAMWETISGFVGGFVTSFKNVLSPIITWIKVNIIDKIANFFSGLWDGIKNGLSSMINGLKSLFGSIADVFKVPINGIIDLINKVLQGLNKTIKVPDWVPGLGGKGVNFPTIPRLAKGGVIDQATMALIGESGSEVVMPLENNTDWIDTLASKINERTGGGQPLQLIVQIGEDKVASKVIELINEKTHMSGRNAIFV